MRFFDAAKQNLFAENPFQKTSLLGRIRSKSKSCSPWWCGLAQHVEGVSACHPLRIIATSAGLTHITDVPRRKKFSMMILSLRSFVGSLITVAS